MITGKEYVMQALIEAFLMEKGTKEFYSQAAEKVYESVAKDTFKKLSQWEQKHMNYIQFLYQSLEGDREIKTFEEFKNKADAPITEAGIPVKDIEAKIEEYDFTDDMKVLTLAMGIEGKAYNLYHKLSQNAVDTNAQVVFKEMMEQELKHVDYLKKLREKLIKVY